MFSLFLTLMVGACKKETVVPAPSSAEILRSKVWKLTSITKGGAASPLETCQTDDKFTFSFSGSFEKNFGTTKCNGELTNSFTGNWSVDETTKILKIVSTLNVTYAYTIKSISATSYVLSYEEPAPLGGSAKVVEETYVPAQ